MVPIRARDQQTHETCTISCGEHTADSFLPSRRWTWPGSGQRWHLVHHLTYRAGLASMAANCISAPRDVEDDCRGDLLSTDLQQFLWRPPLQTGDRFVRDRW